MAEQSTEPCSPRLTHHLTAQQDPTHANPQDLSGKTYIVTGANSGIGYEAAKNFASRGATLALVCRSESRGRDAVASIIAATGNAKVSLYVADALLADFPVIDVLCNSAGGGGESRAGPLPQGVCIRMTGVRAFKIDESAGQLQALDDGFQQRHQPPRNNPQHNQCHQQHQ